MITPTCQRLKRGTSCLNFNRKLSNLDMKNLLTTIARCHELMRERRHWTEDMMEMNMTMPSSTATQLLLSNDDPVGRTATWPKYDLYHMQYVDYWRPLPYQNWVTINLHAHVPNWNTVDSSLQSLLTVSTVSVTGIFPVRYSFLMVNWKWNVYMCVKKNKSCLLRHTRCRIHVDMHA